MSDEVLVNPTLDNGHEHRVGADLYDWEYNNTYDIDRVVPDVKTFIDQLYTHTLDTQAVMCGISRMCGSMADFRRDVEVNRKLGLPYYSYTLEIPIKNIRCFKNLALRRANPRIYTIHDTCQMTDMFESRLMMFINGEYYPAVKFYASSDRFVLIIQVNNGELSLDRLKSWINNGFTWSLLSIPFSTVKHKYGLTSSLVKNGIIPLTSLDNVSNAMFIKRNLWIVSINGISNETGVCTTTLATLVTAPDGTPGLKLNPSVVNSLTSTYVTIEATAFPNIKGGILLGQGRSMQITLEDNPIPPQNIICWETDEDGNFVKYIHNETIVMYYPNIYTIENVDPSTNLYVTWCYSDESTTHFYNPLEEYMKYNASYAADVINSNLPKAIRDYIPYESKYTEPHYLDYFDQATRRNDLTFKFETLKDLIADDTRRLEKLYVDNVIRSEYQWHSNPHFIFKTSECGTFDNRIRRDNSQELEFADKEDFGVECIYITIDHKDECYYPVAVWLDGIRCMKIWQYTEKFRTFVYIPRELVSTSTIIEVEIMKTRTVKPTTVMLELGDKHNSVLIPDDFLDVSPQSMIVAVQEDTSDIEDNGSYRHIYHIAPNYEMYWLLMGNIAYKNGIPIIETDATTVTESTSKTVIESQDDVLLEETGKAITAGNGTLWSGGEDAQYLAERGRVPNFIQVPDEQFPEDYQDLIKVRSLGYYNNERRRFFDYMQNSDDDAPIYITPITNYFANKVVKLTNIDIHKTWNFVIRPDDIQITLKDFALDPTVDKFRVYLNGRLLDAYKDYLIDASLPNGFYMDSSVTFAIIAPFIGNGDVLIEYIPYRYKLLYRLTDVQSECIELRTDAIKRPFSLVYYDVYVNGVKLYADDIDIKSPSKIIIKVPVVGGTVSFYERAHDPDIYENDKEMRKALIDKISDQDNNFRKWLLPNVETSPSGGIATVAHDDVSCGSGCASSCSATCENLCGTGCSGECTMGCVGSCLGTCANEATSNSCAGCGAGCANSCYGCTNTCAANCGGHANSVSTSCAGCDGMCNDSCAASTTGYSHTTCDGCAASCGETCDNTCVGTVTANTAETSTYTATCIDCASSCFSTCLGDCSGSVTSAACSGCAGTCINECGGCSGNCTGSSEGHIVTSCDSCSSTCTTSCEQNCGRSCETSCIGNCIGCTGTCDNQCTVGCIDTCKDGCESNCASTASASACSSCTTSCDATTTGRAAMCAGCYTQCVSSCGLTCGAGCGGTCANTSSGSGANASCHYACSSECTLTCTSTCSTACLGTCNISCAGTCDNENTNSATDDSPWGARPICSSCDNTCISVCAMNCSGTAMSQTAGCNSCDTNCYTACTSTCRNTCEGMCAVNSCTSNCTSHCSGCSHSASSNSISCSDCTTSCTGCTVTCSINCGAECSGGCTGCSGCSKDCTSACSVECTNECYGECSDSCSVTCTLTCASRCTGCGVACSTSCAGFADANTKTESETV